jgi:AraC-like DNA-binding protein
MAEGSTFTFSDPDAYTAAFGDVRFNLTITGAGDFKSRLTWLKLKHLEVYWCCENLSRIAYIALPSDRIYLSFPIGIVSAIFGGLALRNGDMVLHGRGERVHQRSKGECWWALMSLPSEQFISCTKALTGQPIASPPASRILRPSRPGASRFQTLLRQACKLAETRQRLIENPEVARALEQEMLHAMVNCVAGKQVDGPRLARKRHAAFMVHFEEELSNHVDQKLDMPTLCARIGVPERTLRVCCAEFLGVSSARYFLLQRLNRVRSALRRADSSKTTVAEVARNHQFLEPGRFAVMYRAAFGESPSDTLHRDRQM